jgi:D-sedoheptulose 7-phosphate isomerase
MNDIDIIAAELYSARDTLVHFMENPVKLRSVEEAANLMAQAIASGKKIISCGNGGSHCDAMHFAEELTGKYREVRRALPAVAISDPGYLTCVGNDFGYDAIFSRFVEGVGQEGDVLLGITTSGNSANVINAVQTAARKGMKTVVLTGNDGGKIAGMADVDIRVEHMGYADRIQEIHIKIIHILILLIEKKT